MKKEEVILELEKSKVEVASWYQKREENLFNKELVSGKWTSGEHLHHLMKSALAVSKGLQMPKAVLLQMFGSLKRLEWTFDKLYSEYAAALKNGAVAPPRMLPDSNKDLNKAEMMSSFESEMDKMIANLKIWGENDLSELALPHPVLGNLSLREMSIFTYLHNRHHLKALRDKY